MAGRWVVGLAAAALSVRGLATALVILRGALIRTGIGALIVGAGELVFQFGRLVQGAGGFGAALGLLGDLAGEVWNRMQLGAVAMGLEILASWAGIRAAIAEALQASLEAVVGFGNATLNTFQGALEAVKVLWSALPGTIGEFAYGAANALIGGVEAMLNGVARRIDGFLEGVNAGLDVLGVEKRVPLIGTIELGGIENPFAGAAADAGVEARAAFEAAFTQTPIAAPDLGLTAGAAAARARGGGAAGHDGRVSRRPQRPRCSLSLPCARRLRRDQPRQRRASERTQGAATGLEAALDGAGDAADRAGGAGRAAGGALSAAADTAKAAWEATAEADTAPLQEKSREIAQGLAQDITGPIKEALKSGEFSWETFAGAISRIAQNLATRLIELAFKPIETALLNAFMGGGGGGWRYPRQPVRLCQRWRLRGWYRTDSLRAGWRGEPPHTVPLRQGCGADGRGRARGDPATAARQGRQARGGDERGRRRGGPCCPDVDTHHQRPRPVRRRRLPRHLLG